MKVLVLGASGTIGSAVAAHLRRSHEVVAASRSGAHRVDLDDPASIEHLLSTLGGLDAVVCCAASVRLNPLSDLTPEALHDDLRAKVFGQIEIVRVAAATLRNNGAIVLTGGTFVSHLPNSAAGAFANNGLEGFVRSAARDLPRGLRLNLVAAGWVSETLAQLNMNPADGTPAAVVAAAYADLVEGTMTGAVVRPGGVLPG